MSSLLFHFTKIPAPPFAKCAKDGAAGVIVLVKEIKI